MVISFWLHLAGPGRGALASEYHNMSYQLWCACFCVRMGYRSLLTDFWISHNGNWPIYYWVVILGGEEEHGASYSTILLMSPFNKEWLFCWIFYSYLCIKKCYQNCFSFLISYVEYNILYYFLCLGGRILFIHLFWYINLQKKRFSQSNLRTIKGDISWEKKIL